jgi:uncharacterized protein (TIGR00369 family)
MSDRTAVTDEAALPGGSIGADILLPGVADGDGDGRTVEIPPRIIRLPGNRLAEMRPHHCFACGELNMQGLRLRLHTGDGACWTETTLEPRFAGWVGIIHGGIVSAILDEVMAWALVAEDCWGVTARMTVDFKRPVTVGQRIRGEGRLVERRRRIARTEGRLFDAETGEELARAEATYVDAPESRKAELKERYGFREIGLTGRDAEGGASVGATLPAGRAEADR